MEITFLCLFYLNRTTKKRKKRRGKTNSVTGILKKNARRENKSNGKET
jgi:hypothetical protein